MSPLVVRKISPAEQLEERERRQQEHRARHAAKVRERKPIRCKYADCGRLIGYMTIQPTAESHDVTLNHTAEWAAQKVFRCASCTYRDAAVKRDALRNS